MASRDTFSMALLPVQQVVFPGILSSVNLRSRSAMGPVRAAVFQDSSVVFAFERSDQEPAPVATTARIVNMDEVSEGLLLTVAGIQRVHILNYRHQGSALVGQFRYASEAEETIPPLLFEEAWALASELSAMVENVAPRQLPQEPAVLSYWIASHVPLSAPTQQELLEIPTSRGRLAKEISLMRTLLYE